MCWCMKQLHKLILLATWCCIQKVLQLNFDPVETQSVFTVKTEAKPSEAKIYIKVFVKFELLFFWL